MEVPERNILKSFIHLLGLYLIYVKLYFRTRVEYRIDTLVALAAGLLAQVSSLVFLDTIFQKIPKLAGWGFYEMLFIFSIAVTGKALNQVFLDVPFSLHSYIRNGTLDVLLLRPVGALFQATGMSMEINGLGSAITGAVIMCYAASHIGVYWTIAKISYLVIALISSMFIQFAVLLTIVISSFWILEIRSVVYPVVWLYDFTRYPLDIFNPVVRTVLTYILPFALGSFYPAAYLLRPAEYAWAGWAVPAAAAGLTLLSYSFWMFGLKHYTSASG